MSVIKFPFVKSELSIIHLAFWQIKPDSCLSWNIFNVFISDIPPCWQFYWRQPPVCQYHQAQFGIFMGMKGGHGGVIMESKLVGAGQEVIHMCGIMGENTPKLNQAMIPGTYGQWFKYVDYLSWAKTSSVSTASKSLTPSCWSWQQFQLNLNDVVHSHILTEKCAARGPL